MRHPLKKLDGKCKQYEFVDEKNGPLLWPSCFAWKLTIGPTVEITRGMIKKAVPREKTPATAAAAVANNPALAAIAASCSYFPAFPSSLRIPL